MKKHNKTVQDKKPNFRDKSGKLFLVRCFICEPDRGRDNWKPAVASGTCAFCGWKENKGNK